MKPELELFYYIGVLAAEIENKGVDPQTVAKIYDCAADLAKRSNVDIGSFKPTGYDGLDLDAEINTLISRAGLLLAIRYPSYFAQFLESLSKFVAFEVTRRDEILDIINNEFLPEILEFILARAFVQNFVYISTPATTKSIGELEKELKQSVASNNTTDSLKILGQICAWFGKDINDLFDRIRK